MASPICTCDAQLQPHDRMERVCPPVEDKILKDGEDDPTVEMIFPYTDGDR